MIDKDKIESIVNEAIAGTGIFLVSVKVSAASRISVLIDTKKGITIDECAAIHRKIENNLDRDSEDFELLVSSPGLDLPFLVPEQYEKNEGKKVEVTDADGNKHTGVLKNITRGGFEIEKEIKIKGKGIERTDVSFNFDQVKTTRIVLTIK